MVPLRDRDLFDQGAVLEQLGFDHADLPRGPITAQVRFAFGSQAEQSGLDFMGVGINFATMAPETRQHLSVFLEAMLGT